MDCKDKHQNHEHVHGPECGHTAVSNGGQTGYLHDSHMHVAHGDHFDCAAVDVSSRNPDRCTPEHAPIAATSKSRMGATWTTSSTTICTTLTESIATTTAQSRSKVGAKPRRAAETEFRGKPKNRSQSQPAW